MTKKLKVYSVNYDGINECMVATTSKRRAAELCDMSINHFNNYGHETGGKETLELALANPEVVYIRKMDYIDTWKKKDN